MIYFFSIRQDFTKHLPGLKQAALSRAEPRVHRAGEAGGRGAAPGRSAGHSPGGGGPAVPGAVAATHSLPSGGTAANNRPLSGRAAAAGLRQAPHQLPPHSRRSRHPPAARPPQGPSRHPEGRAEVTRRAELRARASAGRGRRGDPAAGGGGAGAASPQRGPSNVLPRRRPGALCGPATPHAPEAAASLRRAAGLKPGHARTAGPGEGRVCPCAGLLCWQEGDRPRHC